MVIPQVVDEPKVGLVPQMHTQPGALVSSDRRSSCECPMQYHWHVQGAVGTYKESRQHLVALAQSDL